MNEWMTDWTRDEWVANGCATLRGKSDGWRRRVGGVRQASKRTKVLEELTWSGGRKREREGGDSWATRETNLKRRPRTLMAGALTIAVRLLETRPKPKQGRDQWRGRERERGAEVCVGVGVARCLAASLVSSVATRAPLKEAVAEELRPQTPRTRAPKTNTTTTTT